MINRHGFTIVETTITVAVASALLGIALPRAAGFVDRMEVRGAVTEVESMFSLARHAAIARASPVYLDIDAMGGIISIRTSTETLRSREVGAAHRVTFATNRTTITYSPIGVGYGAANLSLVISRNRMADTVVVSRLGRVRH